MTTPRSIAHADRSATFAFWAFLAAALLGLTVFTIIPILWGFLLSLSHAQNTILGGGGQTAGTQALARPPLVSLYSIAFNDQNFGLGAAGGFILTAIIVAVTLVQGRLSGFGGSDE